MAFNRNYTMVWFLRGARSNLAHSLVLSHSGGPRILGSMWGAFFNASTQLSAVAASVNHWINQ